MFMCVFCVHDHDDAFDVYFKKVCSHAHVLSLAGTKEGSTLN